MKNLKLSWRLALELAATFQMHVSCDCLEVLQDSSSLSTPGSSHGLELFHALSQWSLSTGPRMNSKHKVRQRGNFRAAHSPVLWMAVINEATELHIS